MRKIISIALIVSFLLTGCRQADAASAEYIIKEYSIDLGEIVPKVILDCDMSYLYDDAMCMCILAQADTLGLIDTAPCTILTNTWNRRNIMIWDLTMRENGDIPRRRCRSRTRWISW